MPPEFSALHRALAECGIETKKIPSTAERLTNLPISFRVSSWDPPETESAILSFVGFDSDMAARMLRLHEGKPDPEATWKNLTPSERKRAKRLWISMLAPDEPNVTPQGRPSEIDPALILYCTRVLCEASGKARFEFRRPMGGGAPGGPMWRALIAALPPEFNEHAETIAEIVAVTRSEKKPDRRVSRIRLSDKFAEWCREFGLKQASSDVAEHPAMFRRAISLARRSRPPKRRRL